MMDDVLHVLQNYSIFVITTHVRPDGDAIGSQLALGLFLKSQGKDVRMINAHAPPANLEWIDGIDDVEKYNTSIDQQEFLATAEVIVVVDTNTMDRLGRRLGPVVRESSALKVLIDHHTDPDSWFDCAWVSEGAAATGEMMFELLADWDADAITPDIATALYVAIVTDTGSFRYSTVTPLVHRITADLLERGSRPAADVYAAIYETRSLQWVRLLSRVLGTLTLLYDGVLGYVVLRRGMLAETGCTYQDADGLVDYALAIEGVEVGLLFTETARGTKVSFRSKGEHAVNRWARSFGGGGHVNASGAFLRRPTDVVISQVLAAAPRFIGIGHAENGEVLTQDDEAYLATLLDVG